MKTIIRTAATVLVLALSSTGVFAADTKKDTTANEVSAVLTYDQGMVEVDLDIDNATEGESAVIITDTAGNVLLTDSFKNNTATIKKVYLVEDVTPGDYIIKVITNNTEALKQVSLGGDSKKEQGFYF